MRKLKDTVERINPVYFRSREKYLLYLRHLFAYEYVITQIPPGASVLEIGFGEGYGSRLMAKVIKEVIAIDIEEAVVRYAQEHYSSPTCRFQAYDGHHLPFPDETFDALVSMQVIEHVSDDVRFVQEAFRVLKNDGAFWLTTPNRTHRVPPGEIIWNKFHVREYYPHELAAVLRTAFAEVNVLGVRGTDEVQHIEHNRVKRGLSFRKLIPEPVKGWLDGDVRQRYSTADLHVTAEKVCESLDLLGCCKK